MTPEVEAAIDRLAAQSRIDPSALKALVEVETSGDANWLVEGKILPPVRFEGHVFYRLLQPQPDKLAEAVKQGLANPKIGAVANPRAYEARYALVERVRAIDDEAGCGACSWGIGQVMGANFAQLGCHSAVDVSLKAMTGLDGQLELMRAYLVSNGLVGPLNRHDWATVARGYNGAGYAANRYDVRLAEAYKLFADPQPASGTRLVQQQLKTLGYDPGPVDGQEGPKTKAAIAKFQQDKGLVADGIAGAMTTEELNQALAERSNGRAIARTKRWGVALAGIGSAAAGAAPNVPDALYAAQNASFSVRGVLEQIGLTGAVAGVIVAAVVGVVVTMTLRRVAA